MHSTDMLTVEEKGSSYTSPRRRNLIIALIVLGLLVFAAIGIVAGYFIGRNSAKGCEDGDTKTTDGGKLSQKQLDEIYKDAVEMVSTKELRSSLE